MTIPNDVLKAMMQGFDKAILSKISKFVHRKTININISLTQFI